MDSEDKAEPRLENKWHIQDLSFWKGKLTDLRIFPLLTLKKKKSFGRLKKLSKTGKGQFSFEFQRKEMPKNVQNMHNCTNFTC